MKEQPLPLNTVPNIAGAIGDLVRSSAVWGAEACQGEPADQTYLVVVRYAMQLFALIVQREPSSDEMGLIFEQLTSGKD